MVTISQACKQLGLSKEEFLKVTEQVTGKSYSPKTSKISDGIFQQVKDYYEQSKNNQEESSERPKVAKEDELFSEEDSFLMELWIQTQEKEKQEPTKEESKEEDVITSFIEEAWKKESKDKTVETTKSLSSTKSLDSPWKQDKKTKDKKSSKDSGKITVQKKSTKQKQFKEDKKSSDTKVSEKDTKKQESKTETKSNQKKSQQSKKEEETPQASSTLKKKEKVTIHDGITIKEFAEKIWYPLPEVMKKLLANKIMLSANSSIDIDTASLIWEEFWVKVEKEKSSEVSVYDILSWDIQSIIQADKEKETAVERPPVVTVMWHVDHGKTKLLDYLRRTNVTTGEAGGITQSIWASQVNHNGKLITFIDTPWHELFTSLRARWSKITDVAIIVVAADDWIKQQTVEAINHAKDAGVPIIVAITKKDVKNANIDLIKSNLAEYGLTPEERWWNTIVVPISSITGEWIDELLEMVTLQSDILELKCDPERYWIWVVLEADKDPKKWITSSLIVMSWELKVGDTVVVGSAYWRIRKMLNREYLPVKKAFWGEPVQVIGLHEMPEPGRIIEAVDSERTAKEKVEKIQEKENESKDKLATQNVMEQLQSWEVVKLKLLIKADSFGSLEATKMAVEKITPPENVSIKVIHSDVGMVSDSDIELAKASDAIIVGFNVKAPSSVKKKAEEQRVDLRVFNIIYELIDYVERLVQGLVKPEEKEVYLWTVDIKWVFFRKKQDMIIWGKITDGKVKNWAYFRVYRDEEEAGGWKITSLKKEKENVDELSKWYECGLRVKTNIKIKEDDILEIYAIE